MKRTAVIARVLVSILGLVLIVLGVLFWTGHALALLPVHMLLGALFAVCLWVLVGLAFSARVSTAFTLSVFVWSLIVLALGMEQVTLLPGSRHWIVQSVHLIVGLIAIGLGHALARQVVRATEGRAPPREERTGS
jgi:hypothetical protein